MKSLFKAPPFCNSLGCSMIYSMCWAALKGATCVVFINVRDSISLCGLKFLAAIAVGLNFPAAIIGTVAVCTPVARVSPGTGTARHSLDKICWFPYHDRMQEPYQDFVLITGITWAALRRTVAPATGSQSTMGVEPSAVVIWILLRYIFPSSVLPNFEKDFHGPPKFDTPI